MERFAVRSLTPLEVAGLPASCPGLPDVTAEVGLWLSYVRLCRADVDGTCVLATEGGAPVGYLLSFVHAGELHCTSLVGRAGAGETLIAYALLAELIERATDRAVHGCWFSLATHHVAAQRVLRLVGPGEGSMRAVRRVAGSGASTEQRWVAGLDATALSQLRGLLGRIEMAHEHELAV